MGRSSSFPAEVSLPHAQDSPLWVIRDQLVRPRHVRSTPVSDRTADLAGGPFRAIIGSPQTSLDRLVGAGRNDGDFARQTG